jgi:hypothetical protein
LVVPVLKTAEIISVNQAVGSHPGEWLVMKVKSVESDGRPRSGELLLHTRHQALAWKKLGKILEREGETSEPYAVFRAVDVLRTGEEMRRALSEIMRTGSDQAWRKW